MWTRLDDVPTVLLLEDDDGRVGGDVDDLHGDALVLPAECEARCEESHNPREIFNSAVQYSTYLAMSAGRLVMHKASGATVATASFGGASTAVGVAFNVARLPQSAHHPTAPYALEKAAFARTKRHSSDAAFAKHLSQLLPVGSPQSAFHRSGMFVRLALQVPRLDANALDLLREVAFEPVESPLSSDEVVSMRQYDRQELQRMHPERYIVELAVHAGYKGLVHSLCTHQDALAATLDADRYGRFLRELRRPERTFMLAVGPDSSALPDAVASLGGDAAAEALEAVVPDDVVNVKALGVSKEPILVEERADEEFTHIGLFVPAIKPSERILYPAQLTLQSLMGGGGSFSAGGPGKGMLSRLYANVLNRHHFLESIRVVCQDGLFGIIGSCHREHVASMLEIMQTELAAMTRRLTTEEVVRARKHAASAILMQAEQRVALFDQLASGLIGQALEPQQLAHDILHPPTDPKDPFAALQSCQNRLLGANPDTPTPFVYVAYGRLPSTLPDIN